MVLKFAFKHQEGRKIIPSTRKGGFPITKKGGIISKHQEERNYIQAPRREELYPSTKKRGIISKHQEERNSIQAPRSEE